MKTHSHEPHERRSEGPVSQSTMTPANPFLNLEPPVPFDQIGPADVAPGIRALLSELDRELEQVERSSTATWDGLVVPIDRLRDRFEVAWGVVGNLLSVSNSEELRAAYKDVLPVMVAFSLRLKQSHPLFERLEQLSGGDAWHSLSACQKRIVESLLREMRHAGVSLEPAVRTEFSAVERELAELGTHFGNNVLDATKAFEMTLTTAEEVRGLPDTLLGMAASSARKHGHPSATTRGGPWRVPLNEAYVSPFLTHSERRDLRERVYRALVTRASTAPTDNRPLIERILRLRGEQARRLGYDTYAELSIANKMAPSVTAVREALGELRDAAYDVAHREFDELAAFSSAHGGPNRDQIKQWDVSFWLERLQQTELGFADEDLRPYFPLPRVLDGLFAVAKRLFNIDVEARPGGAPVWHDDVRYFDVRRDGTVVASFYLDLFARPGVKQQGAWQSGIFNRSRNSHGRRDLRTPVTVMVCNQAPPVSGRPSLMKLGEVRTLFHEFGHALHHMLTSVDTGLAAGTSGVEWDAVELPSMFMENWVFQPNVLRELSSHVETGESLPEEWIEKIVGWRRYRSAPRLLRQVCLSLTDLELHDTYDPDGPERPMDVFRRVARENSILAPLPEDVFLCAFGHIFSGGYAAGYYSYLWANIMSADAFSAFEEAGLEDTDAIASTGRRFRDTVLALGGSVSPAEVFERFRGRAPSTDALLRHLGLASS